MISQPTRAKVKQDFARIRLGRTELDSPAKTVASINSIFRDAFGTSKSEKKFKQSFNVYQASMPSWGECRRNEDETLIKPVSSISGILE